MKIGSRLKFLLAMLVFALSFNQISNAANSATPLPAASSVAAPQSQVPTSSSSVQTSTPIAVTPVLNLKSKSLVIIDTGYDPTVSEFNGKIVYEACFTNKYCPNGDSFQEGTGSASLTQAQLKGVDTLHGTQMLSASIATNPNLKYVYIRAYGINAAGYMNSPVDADFLKILNWVDTNSAKLNVGGIVWSAARQVTSTCPKNDAISTEVIKLKTMGIPVIAPSGNNYDYTHVGFPACLQPIIAIGSIDAYGHALYSNAGAELDFDAMGTLNVSNGGATRIQAVGTSVAAQVFAASWMSISQAKPNLSYGDIYSLIQRTQTFSKNSKIKDIPTLNMRGALQ